MYLHRYKLAVADEEDPINCIPEVNSRGAFHQQLEPFIRGIGYIMVTRRRGIGNSNIVVSIEVN